MGLVLKRISTKFYNVPIEGEDLISIGCLGMAKCLDSYDPSKGEFSPFATKAIDTAIYRVLNQNANDIETDSLDRVVYKGKKGCL